ncbi:Endoplasmic reticulum resident protein 27, partial [Pristimantis euphronides]
MCGSQASEPPVIITALLNESSSLHYNSAGQRDRPPEDTMSQHSCFIMAALLLLLMTSSLASDTGNGSEIAAPERTARILGDVPSAKAFIDSTDIAVVGFFVDPEMPEVGYFNTLVKNHPEWDFGTTISKDVLKHYKIESNAISIFRKADNFRDDLVVEETLELNTAKLYRFLSINELRLVTEYNPMTSIGIIACKVHVHLLFFTHEEVEGQEEIMKELREAAEELRGR